MDNKIKTQNWKFICPECKNEVICDPKLEVDDVVECPFCGMEYESTSKEGDEFILQMIEEEK